MARRIPAVVNVTMTPDEVAEFLGLPVAAVVDYGNGTALIDIVEDILTEDEPEDAPSDEEE